MTALYQFDSYESAKDWCEAHSSAVTSVVVKYFPSHYEYIPNLGMFYVPPPIRWLAPNPVPNWVRQANDAYYAWRDKWGFTHHRPPSTK